jgi:hypothetical protein
MRDEHIRRSALALALSLVFLGSALSAFGQRIPVVKKRALLIKPDLAVTDIRPDNDCALEVDVKNVGLLAVDSMLVLRVTIGGRTVFDEKIHFDLASQGTQAVSARAPGVRLAGRADVAAWVDADKTLAEADEDNNRLSKTLSCVPLPQDPDLALSDLRPDPEDPQTLGLVSFRLLLANAGSEPLPQMGLSIPWRWRVKDGSWDPVGRTFTATLKSLAPGESAWLDVKDQGFMPDEPGEYEFEVGEIIIGSGLAAKESNLANNRRSVIFTVRSNILLPDLTVAGLTVEPAIPSAESQIVVRAVIANRGPGRAPTFDTRIRILQDGRTIRETVNNLWGFGPGGTHDYQIVLDRLPAGLYAAEVQTDLGDKAKEGSESNNSLVRSLEVVASGGTVLRPPDIAVEDVAPEPGMPKAGDFVGFRVLLANRGPDPLPETPVSITWQVRPQGQPWPYVGHSFGAILKALAPGESAWVKAATQSFGTDKAGTYEVWISDVFLTGALTGRERELANNKKIVPILVK